MSPTPGTMKAVRIHRYGPPDVLQCEDVPRPEPAEGEVLVRVRAASVNSVDWKIRAGYLQQMIPYPLPIVLGLDFSGTIVAAGPGTTGAAGGEDIYGKVDLMRLGTYADYAVARLGELTAKPRSVDHVHAAAVPLVALTAWQSLIAGADGAPSIDLTRGQRLLIHGAAGGVGSFAVQLAKWRGAYVIATARAEDAAFVRGLGADEVIDYAKERFEDVAGSVDAVLDLIGGDTQARSWKLLNAGGVLASTMGQPKAEETAPRDIRAIGVMAKMDISHLDELTRLIDAGIVRPQVSEVFPLAQTAIAHARVEAGQVQGKVVLETAQ